MQQNNKQKSQQNSKRSVFSRIFLPMLALVVMDVLIVLLVLQLIGVVPRLNQNSFDILTKQVGNRQGYLQAQMTEKWMKLDKLADHINLETELLLRKEKINLDTLDSISADTVPLIMAVKDQMISALYDHQVSGIYLVFNTHDLNADIAEHNWREKTGICIRDNDPLAAASERYDDLLLECAPVQVVQALPLSTDRNWRQKFYFSEEHPYESWLTDPYEKAQLVGEKLKATDCGLWSLRHDEDGTAALTYSMPLILSDGTVYGVLGVEMLPSFLNTQIPGSELDENGVYLLLMSEQTQSFPLTQGTVFAVSGKKHHFQVMENVSLTGSDYGGYEFYHDNTQYAAAVLGMLMYSRNAPFEDQHWYMIGAVPTGRLYAFSGRLYTLLIGAAFVMLVFGFVGSLVASWHITRPIRALRKELEASKGESIPQLSQTGISEVDDFADAITKLSNDVVNSSNRFLSIMHMSSIDMAGYEVDPEKNYVFVTENFYSLFGMKNVDTASLTVDKFHELQAEISKFASMEQMGSGGMLYAINLADDSVRYLHVQETVTGKRRIGVVEDVTIQTLERKHIEHERDYDLLTGIYNYRAFRRDAGLLLEKPEQLGTAVVVMIDLDNLKQINDTYGHEWGDRYIVEGARCIQRNVSSKSVIARVSGDEFMLLLYGFADEQQAREAVNAVNKGFIESTIVLPDQQIRNVSSSGGYAFVGKESKELNELGKFADFAMYLVKKSKKGSFGEFDPASFHASEIHRQKHNAFQRVIQGQKIKYVFQPIVNARTGAVYAYEALMRVIDNEIMNVEEFLSIATQENALDEVERLTWFHSLESFQRLVQTGEIPAHCKVFINSIVSHVLDADKQRQLIERFGDIRGNAVMEVLETDDHHTDLSKLRKPEYELFAHMFALDDFGTGYNSEKNLLDLMPQFVKLDMSLVRDVEKHGDRQLLISGLIAFAHERDMLVLAEGVETMAELSCLLTLGIDLIQGFLMAHPAEVPQKIDEKAVAFVQAFSRRSREETQFPE